MRFRHEPHRPAGRGAGRVSLIGLLILTVARIAGGETLQVDAVEGRPYGVGTLTVQFDSPLPRELAEAETFLWRDAASRISLPLADVPREKRILGRLLNQPQNEVSSLTIYFLFTGSEPFNAQWQGATSQTVRVVPRPGRRREHARLLQRWRRQWDEVQQDGGLLQQYVAAMLLGEPSAVDRTVGSPREEPLRLLKLALGAESVRDEVRAATLAVDSDRQQAADRPLPPPMNWPSVEIPQSDELAAATIEPIAAHVPEECFYIRFGSFSNYLWLNQLITDSGGDLANMVAPSGVERLGSEQVQRQLGLKQSALAEVLGPAVIADVAIIGLDMYVQDGAAIGILFQARNALLGTDLTKQRDEARISFAAQGAREEKVIIEGREVSLVSTPDNQLRSFYVVDGDYHLVTTSRHLVQRFLQAGAGQAALADLAEFRYARRTLPLDRNDTIFLYLSTPFLQQIVSPHHQIELRRRLRAATDMQLLWLAHLAAGGDVTAASDAFDLVERELLPASFTTRPEEGEILLERGRLRDTLRGVRGSFLPIADMRLEGATPSELEHLQAQEQYFLTHWKQFDPIMVAVQRAALNEPLRERISIEAYVSPLNETKFGKWLSVIGPASPHRMTYAPGDIISIQAFLQGGRLSGAVPPHHLFLGVQDMPPPRVRQGLLSWLTTLRFVPAYLGAWPKPGYLDWLPGFLGGGPPDVEGYSQLPLGLWRRQWGDFSVLSFQRPLLEHITPHLALADSEDAAQLRLYIGDLSQSQLQPLVHDLSARRALETSTANARLAARLTQWLHVPTEQALTAAGTLLGGDLVCPLGGSWQRAGDPQGSGAWVSTAWNNPDTAPPHRAPLLDWFRGLNLDVTRSEAGLLLRAELDIQRAASTAPAEIPLFNFFKSQRPSAAPPEEIPQGTRQ